MAGGIRTYGEAVAIITGAGSGIGAALPKTPARRCAVGVALDRHIESAEETRGAIEHAGGQAEAVEADVRDPARIAAMIDRTFDRHGRLDYLFNNAGIGVGAEALACTLDDWRYVV